MPTPVALKALIHLLCSVLSDVLTPLIDDIGFTSQCTFWCSVLSDTSGPVANNTQTKWSQCTFWCSVLSDRIGPDVKTQWILTLSQCTFWCSVLSDQNIEYATTKTKEVSMHLLVRSAFRATMMKPYGNCRMDVSMHLLVLSAFRQVVGDETEFRPQSQCTFWCSVLSDQLSSYVKLP